MSLTARIRSQLRRHLPEPLRRFVAQARRRIGEARASSKFAFVTARLDESAMAGMHCVAEIVQPIRQTAHYEGKVHNIRLAVARMNGLTLRSGEALSFWRVLGMPTARNGYQLGRGIIGDRLSADVGGGLCQIASLLYELGLRGGLTIIERHPHSRDLYTEDNRFTPLGLDATVVWGFKDVRLGNLVAARVAFEFAVGDVTRSYATVTAKRTEGSRGIVSLDVWQENQLGQRITTGTAEVALPTRAS